ncbi:hypothetical protein NL676_033453 [Syzygium grande]|nr:hypothetical protein NL676_033453 [Syzygium grande]
MVVVVMFRAEVLLVVVVIVVLEELMGVAFVLIASLQDILLIIAMISILSYRVYMFILILSLGLLCLDLLLDRVIDSGATHHMTGDPCLLTSTLSIPSTSVALADGSQSKVTSSGSEDWTPNRWWA